MRFALLLGLLAPAVAAQAPPDSLAVGPSPAPTSLLVAAGAACGTMAAVGTGSLLNDEPGAALAVALVGGTAACVWGVARARGHTGPFLPTLVDTGLGLAVAAGASYGVAGIVYLGAGGDRAGGTGFLNDAALAALLAAGVTMVVVPAAVAAWRLPRHARPVPTALRTPDGSSAPGVALRVRL